MFILCVVCFSFIHCCQQWPRTSQERGSDVLTWTWIAWKWRRVALCLSLSLLSWVIWGPEAGQVRRLEIQQVESVKLYPSCSTAPVACWWLHLAHTELIHPFTGFVFSPAGWHVTLLTSIVLMEDHYVLFMWQVILCYSTCIISSRVQPLGNLDMLTTVKIAHNL